MSLLNYVSPEKLGSSGFKSRYGLKYAYVSGAMYKGIASKEMVLSIVKSGMLGFYGTGGVSLEKIEKVISFIKSDLSPEQTFGMNLLNNVSDPKLEEETVDLYLKYGVSVVEASAFVTVSPALVKYRLSGITLNQDGSLNVPNRVIAKVSRPEVAESFMSPPSEKVVAKLLAERKITQEEARYASRIAVADDICVEADSGGHTDAGRILSLLPAIMALRDELNEKHHYERAIHIGAAGGIGTPESAGAAFILGADFITTGSINQCTRQAGTSDAVKDMLQAMEVQDTDYAPAGDMFEIGAKVQVLRQGVLFPSRGKKLYELYCSHNSLEEIDAKTRHQIETKFFKKTFDEVWQETRSYYEKSAPEMLEKAEKSSKVKMALVFRWYFVHCSRLALQGDPAKKVDFQIHCGPALGAFNKIVKGTPLEDWRNRDVDKIAMFILDGAAKFLNEKYLQFTR